MSFTDKFLSRAAFKLQIPPFDCSYWKPIVLITHQKIMPNKFMLKKELSSEQKRKRKLRITVLLSFT